LDQRVQDLERLLDHLNIKKNITFVLHDWGGMIGMAYAIRHPGRICRLIVFNTAAFHLPKDKTFPWPLRVCRDTPVGTLLVRGLNVFSLAAAAFCCRRRPLPRAVRKAYLAPYNSWHNRIAVLRFVQDIPLNPGDPSYGAVSAVEAGLDRLKDTPMLVCWGLRDFVFDKHFLAQWLRYFPNAEFHAFAKAGHYVLEDACEEIIPLVDTFLKKHPSSIA
jgi:haloalkane dehalogenase